MIPRIPISFDRNVGGLNMALSGHLVSVMELVDCDNMELSPGGGYRVRPGCAAVGTSETAEVIDPITGIIRWEAPNGGRHVIVSTVTGKFAWHSGASFTTVPYFTAEV